MTATLVRLTRRSVVAGLAGVGLAACSRPEPAPPATAQTSQGGTTATTSGLPRRTSGATLRPAKPYTPLPGEIAPRCKITAVEAVGRALTWTDGRAGEIGARLKDLHNGAQLAAALDPLLSNDDACVTSVVYPQYGGLNVKLTSASVMLVGRQVLLGQGESVSRTRDFIVDVRLSRAGQEWNVTGATVGKVPATTRISVPVQRLLDNPKVVLPTPARADLAAGAVSDEVVSILEGLSRRWRLSVQVLRTGHPKNVFGTDRLSNHNRGRAVDIWAIDETPLIGSARDLWEPIVIEAARLGSTEIGAPNLPLNARGLPSVFFTNATHQDHLHLGFEVVKRR